MIWQNAQHFMICHLKNVGSIILLWLLPFSTQAQTEKSYWAHGGSFGGQFSLGRNSQNRNFTAFINGGTGYFFIDRLFTGINLMGEFGKSNGVSNYSFGGGPVLRYYLLSNENAVNFFPEVSYLFGLNGGSGGQNPHRLLSESCPTYGLGLSYFIKQEIALELLGTYLKRRPDEFAVQSRFNTTIGLRFHLKK